MKKNKAVSTTDNAWHARQGDVLIKRVDSLPADAVERVRDNGRVILAYGEVTGHCHQIDTPETAMLFDVPSTRSAPTDTLVDPLTYLAVDELSQLVHDEHAAITLEPGVYQVIRQREYTPLEIRSVLD